MTPEPQLADFFLTCQKRVESSLSLHLANTGNHHAQLDAALQHACLKGGKRVRPVLAYGSVLAVGGELAQADDAACAVELIHCYSLVHDDLPAMDDDDLRRGIPTVHKAYGEALAILAGDALQSLAFQVLAGGALPGRNAEQRLAMVTRLARAAGVEGMVSGQALDFTAVGQTLDLGQLQAMHSLKTGALIGASVVLGALSGPALDRRQLQALENYAALVGLAFQVQDDILDVTTQTGVLGKTQGADEALKKPTFTSVLGVAGAQEKARQLAADAVQSLSDFPAAADLLRQLALYIVERRY